jgi:alpha-amylase/alpha-mannosidase (GH57 family)
MIHNHQPIGNFKDVFLKAFYNSYIPFLEKILKYKNINIALHTSGILFEFMEENNIKDYEDIIKELLKENRIELVSGTFYEAILSLIPDEDKINQIKIMNDYLKNKFNFTPKGMWLTERIWEPDLPKYIKKAGIEYTLVDDNAFRKLGFDEESLFNYYITENEGYTLNIFPILKTLRYLIPFRDVNEVFNFMRKSKGNDDIFTYGDDGEKFGMWPGTYEHVYKNGYLDKFLSNLNEFEDIKTIKFSDILKIYPPKDRVYLNVSSYEEMEEWSNGNFRNFLSKYNESNKMHKRMLFFRNNIKSNEKSYNFLLKSQCNDAYWHGIFGGLYLPHLRRAIYKEILNGENFLEKKDFYRIEDFDKDGIDEVILFGEYYNIFIHQKGAKVIEIDKVKDNINLSDVITRYRESYHEKLLKEIDKNNFNNYEVKTIHDIFSIKDSDVYSFLKFDRYFKENFLIHYLNDIDSLKDSTPIYNKFDYKILNQNKVEFNFNEIEVIYEVDEKIKYKLKTPKLTNFLVLEMNLYFPEDKIKIDKDFVTFNIDENKRMYIKTEDSFEILNEKIFTVSSSESGIEKIYQGETLFFVFNLKNDINKINLEIGDLYEK